MVGQMFGQSNPQQQSGVLNQLLRSIGPSVLSALGGGILGRLHHKNLGMSTEEQTRIVGELQGGKAAVGVLATGEQADAITGKLAELGGDVEAHEVTDEALDAVAAAAPVEPDAAAASA